MNDHLSEMEVAALSVGAGTEAFRAARSLHLSTCAACREAVVAAVRAERSLETVASGPLEAEALVEIDRLQRAFDETHGTAQRTGEVLILRLRRMASAGLEAARDLISSALPEPVLQPLRADAPANAPGGELPSLVTEDGQTIVRFRRESSGTGLRAFVIAPRGVLPPSIVLSFPKRNLAFTVSEEGEALLDGINAEDLVDSQIEIRLRPLQEDN